MKSIFSKAIFAPILAIVFFTNCNKTELIAPSPEPAAVEVVEVEKGGQEDEFVMVKGSVKSQSGNPIAGANIRLVQNSQTLHVQVTDANGDWQLPEVLVGNYEFEITATGHNSFNESLNISTVTTRTDHLTAI